jgi:hypothetical protein
MQAGRRAYYTMLHRKKKPWPLQKRSTKIEN